MELIINDIISKIIEHRDYYKNNEYAVRSQLVEPILDNLGWNTKNPKYVQFNTHTENKDIPDYTLIINKKVATYIEAKNLSTNILDKQCLSQIAKYCNSEGKRFGILTNGNDWLVLKTFEEDININSRIVWKISLDKDSISHILSKLNLIAYEQIENLGANLEIEKSIDLYWEQNVNEKEILISNLTEHFTKDFLLKNALSNNNAEFIKSNIKNKVEKLIINNIPFIQNNINSELNQINIPLTDKTFDSDKEKDDEFIFLKSSGIQARGKKIGKKIIVHKGSQAVIKIQSSLQNNLLSLRESLIQSDILKKQGDTYTFQNDYQFNSLSQASAVILGSSTNGWIIWKDRNGNLLKRD